MGIVDYVIAFVAVLIIIGLFLGILSRYRIASSNQILVITGKVRNGKSAKVIHGGATFVFPVFQKYEYLDLSPIQIDINLTNALSAQNIRVNVPSSFTIAIGTDESLMLAASERLLDKTRQEISNLSKDIIFGQLRATIADMSIEEINKDRDKFITNIRTNVENELKKIGLVVLNVNITDITDESNYIDALGQKAASEAVNKAKVEVAQQNRDGNIGQSQAEKEQRIGIAEANASAVKGENDSKKLIAISNAELKVQEEESKSNEESAKLTFQANAATKGIQAETETEKARIEKTKVQLEAEQIVPAKIEKDKIIINAEAKKQELILKGQSEGEAEKFKVKEISEGLKIQGETEAEIIRIKAEAEAKGVEAMLIAKAKGFEEIIKKAGNIDNATKLLMIEQLPTILNIQSDAMKNIKIDKITIWDSGNGKNGGNSTQNFVKEMFTMLPGLQDVLNQTDLEMPEWLIKNKNNIIDNKENIIDNKEDIVDNKEDIVENK